MIATYQITEYGSFVAEKALNGFVSIPQNAFDGLEDFILSNSSRNSEALDLMGLSVKKGIGKVITAKNYVGIITMKDGSTIEILPKIYSRVPQNEKMVKHPLVDMLRSLHNSPCKSIQTTKVGSTLTSISHLTPSAASTLPRCCGAIFTHTDSIGKDKCTILLLI